MEAVFFFFFYHRVYVKITTPFTTQTHPSLSPASAKQKHMLRVPELPPRLGCFWLSLSPTVGILVVRGSLWGAARLTVRLCLRWPLTGTKCMCAGKKTFDCPEPTATLTILYCNISFRQTLLSKCDEQVGLMTARCRNQSATFLPSPFLCQYICVKRSE